MSNVSDRIRKLLDDHGVAYRELQHEPTYTSEESARARGEALRIGGKALLVKADDERYRLFVMPADRRLDSAAVRRELGLRKLRFASREELAALTGLEPGSVPPFGRPVLPFDLFVDEGIRDNQHIAFNAGSLTTSIVLATGDYLAVARPVRVFSFGKSA